MNIHNFAQANTKHYYNNTFNSPKKQSFCGTDGDAFVFAKKQEHKKEKFLDKIFSYFSSNKNSEYVNKSTAEKILQNGPFAKTRDKSCVKSFLEDIKEEQGYSISVLNDINKIWNDSPEITGFEIIQNCRVNGYSCSDNKINKESQKAFLSSSRKLLEKGIPPKTLSNLLDYLSVSVMNYPPESAELLVSELPNEEDKELLAKFIQERFKAVYQDGDLGLLKNQPPRMKNFEMMNKLYNANYKWHSKKNLEILSALFRYQSKHNADLAYEIAKYAKPESVKKLEKTFAAEMSDKILKYAQKIDEQEKASFYNGLCKVKSNRVADYLELVPRLKSIDKGGEWLASCLAYCTDSNPDFLEFFKEHFYDENILFYLKVFYGRNKTTDEQFLGYGSASNLYSEFKPYMEMKVNKDWICNRFIYIRFPFTVGTNTSKKIKNDFDYLVYQGYNPEFVLPVLDNSLFNCDKKTILDLMQLATQKRTTLGSVVKPFTNLDIINLFSAYSDKIIKTVGLLGKDSFAYLFNRDSEALEDTLEVLGDANLDFSRMQGLIEIINPHDSVKVKKLEKTISSLKSQFHSVRDDNKRKVLIAEINTATKEKNTIINNAIKDPLQKINAAEIYISMIDNLDDYKTQDYTRANKILPYLNPQEFDGEIYKKKLNDVIWEVFGVEKPVGCEDKFDFSKSRYIEKLFAANLEFVRPFRN